MKFVKTAFLCFVSGLLFQCIGAELEFAPLFHSCGVICRTKELMQECSVTYRKKGSSEWLPAFEAVYDPSFGEKFRTSIVDLEPDTEYEVRAVLSRKKLRETAAGTFRTWAEKVPVGKTIVLTPERLKKGLVITSRGKADSWIRYTAAPGTVIDGKDAKTAVTLKEAEYVILENLTIRGGANNAVSLDNCKHVRLVNCDIGFWGDPENWTFDGATGRMRNRAGQPLWNKNAIFINRGEGIVIERCYIHDPLLSANNWVYAHPDGSQGIAAFKPRSTVIRYNDICASDLKWWNDGIAGNRNFDLDGGLNRDCDVYGNFLAFANDDGIELDGGQQNVRFFRNHIENCFMGVSIQGCMTGPSFIFENRIVDLRDEFLSRSSAFKTADIWGGHYAASFFYNNTTDQSAARIRLCRNFRIVAVNNILEAVVPSPISFPFLKTAWHHNLVKSGAARGNFTGAAGFADPERGIYTLKEDSPARGKAAVIPGLNNRASRDLGAPQNLELPYRPFPLTLTDGRKVTFTVKKGRADPPQTVTVRADAPVSFTVRKSKDSDWYEVTPAQARLKAGEKLTLTVKIDPGKMNSRNHYRSAFFLRSPEGWSRPVSVAAVTDFKYPPLVPGEKVRVFVPEKNFAKLPGGAVRFAGRGKTVSFPFEVKKSVSAFLCAEVRITAESGKSSVYACVDSTKPEVCTVRTPETEWHLATLKRYTLAPGKHTLTVSPRETLELKAFYLIFDDAALKERR